MPSLIQLKGEITLQNLESFFSQLQPCLSEAGEVVLSCRDLEFLDTAAFQLLVSFKKSLGKRALLFQEVPAQVRETATLLGLNTFFGLGG
ncbi:MAG: STAS domain-containing protein [Thermodesulfobacteriota bacterium]